MLPLLSTTLLSPPIKAQTTPNAPLASWNEGAAKQAILDFVRATTDQGSSKFVPVEDRIATFDQDGTLWVEHPIYTQVTYCLDRVSTLAAQKPELKGIEPFKTVLSGDREAMAKLSMHDRETILGATLTGANQRRDSGPFTRHPPAPDGARGSVNLGGRPRALLANF